MTRTMIQSLFVLCVLGSGLCAQDALRTLFVIDQTGDDIRQLVDLNYDNDFNDPGEDTRWLDSTLNPLGNVADNSTSLVRGPDNRLYGASINNDWIYRAEDLNGDGDANDAGEVVIVFDGSSAGANLSGIEHFSVNEIRFDDLGRMIVAHADAGAGGNDAIYRLEDANADGDFNDIAECVLYYDIPVSGTNVGDSLPGSIAFGQDGKIYYVEVSGNGFYDKGVYVLEDTDMSGTIDPVLEVSAFYLPSIAAGSTNQFYWSLRQDLDGYWYMQDTLGDRLLRFRDDNGDGMITEATESVEYWTSSAPLSNIWMICPDEFGNIYVCEDQTPDRILVFQDKNNNGMIDASEVDTVSDETVSGVSVGRPRDVVFVDRPNVYPGNGTDAAIDIRIGGRPSESTDGVHTMLTSQVLELQFNSPFGTLNGAPFAAGIQLIATGAMNPGLLLDPADLNGSFYLNLIDPIYVLLDGISPGPSLNLIPVVGSWNYVAVLPPILGGSGLSLMVEMLVLDPGLNGVGVGSPAAQELRIG